MLTLLMSAGAAPANVWVTEVLDGSVMMQEMVVGSAAFPAEVNVLVSSATSFAES